MALFHQVPCDWWFRIVHSLRDSLIVGLRSFWSVRAIFVLVLNCFSLLALPFVGLYDGLNTTSYVIPFQRSWQLALQGLSRNGSVHIQSLFEALRQPTSEGLSCFRHNTLSHTHSSFINIFVLWSWRLCYIYRSFHTHFSICILMCSSNRWPTADMRMLIHSNDSLLNQHPSSQNRRVLVPQNQHKYLLPAKTRNRMYLISRASYWSSWWQRRRRVWRRSTRLNWSRRKPVSLLFFPFTPAGPLLSPATVNCTLFCVTMS